MSETLIEKLEKCGFECQAGPLENSVQYRDLKDRTDLWALEVRAGRELRRAVAHLMLLVETKTPPELCGDALGSIAFALAKYPSQEKE